MQMNKEQALDVAQIVQTTPRLTRVIVRAFRRPLNRLIYRIVARAYERGQINSHQMHSLLAQFDPTQQGVFGQM
jgi:hypothetical protein